MNLVIRYLSIDVAQPFVHSLFIAFLSSSGGTLYFLFFTQNGLAPVFFGIYNSGLKANLQRRDNWQSIA